MCGGTFQGILPLTPYSLVTDPQKALSGAFDQAAGRFDLGGGRVNDFLAGGPLERGQSLLEMVGIIPELPEINMPPTEQARAAGRSAERVLNRAATRRAGAGQALGLDFFTFPLSNILPR